MSRIDWPNALACALLVIVGFAFWLVLLIGVGSNYP